MSVDVPSFFAGLLTMFAFTLWLGYKVDKRRSLENHKEAPRSLPPERVVISTRTPTFPGL